MASSGPTTDLRLPPYFPAVPKACREAAAPFMTCFSDASAYEGDVKDAGIGREALQKCWDKLPQYTACAEKHLTAKQRETWSAPSFYLGGGGGEGKK